MSGLEPVLPLDSFQTFGDLLKYARRRARLTQREVAVAVGYSEAQISRLEQNLRPPDLAAVTALFIPALYLEDEPEIVARLIELAAQARGESIHQNGTITFARSVRQEVVESVRTVEENVLNNLPFQLTSFVGREREIAEIKLLLGKAKLVTLTGSGGSGKTRLALETAGQVIGSYRDGIWLIELAAISDSNLVLQAVASTLGILELRDAVPTLGLTRYLRTKQTLLILDNCEQVVAAVAQVAEEILRACPNVQIIATSREILNIPGELRFPVPPLSLPDRESFTGEAGSQSESVRLFIERAQSVFPMFTVYEDNLSSMIQICRQLDGMPLAIELAAARTGTFSIQQIAARLENSFQLLRGGRRTLPRHQTLEATIEWSYNLLSEAERVLFVRLSTFSGGWTLEAAESVVSDSSLVLTEKTVDLLSQLVNKSLVVAEWQARLEPRYRLLQTIHMFALEKLRTTNELERMRARHFDYFFSMAQQAEERLFAEPSSLDWAEAEMDNIRAALTWALQGDSNRTSSEERTGRALELILHLWPLWLNRGYSAEGEEWLNQFLPLHTGPTPARARALLLTGDLAAMHGDPERKAMLIRESLALARQLEDPKRIAWGLMEMGMIEREGDHRKGVEYLTESLERFEELEDSLWISRVSYLLAETHVTKGNLEAAEPLWKKGLELSRAANDQFHIAWGLEGLGNIARREGHFEQAGKLYLESLPLKVRVMDKIGIAYSLAAFAQLAAAQKHFERAALLWGAAEGLSEIINLRLLPPREELYSSLNAESGQPLEEQEFQAAWVQGKRMKMQEAVDYALTHQPD